MKDSGNDFFSSCAYVFLLTRSSGIYFVGSTEKETFCMRESDMIPMPVLPLRPRVRWECDLESLVVEYFDEFEREARVCVYKVMYF